MKVYLKDLLSYNFIMRVWIRFTFDNKIWKEKPKNNTENSIKQSWMSNYMYKMKREKIYQHF